MIGHHRSKAILKEEERSFSQSLQAPKIESWRNRKNPTGYRGKIAHKYEIWWKHMKNIQQYRFLDIVLLCSLSHSCASLDSNISHAPTGLGMNEGHKWAFTCKYDMIYFRKGGRTIPMFVSCNLFIPVVIEIDVLLNTSLPALIRFYYQHVRWRYLSYVRYEPFVAEYTPPSCLWVSSLFIIILSLEITISVLKSLFGECTWYLHHGSRCSSFFVPGEQLQCRHLAVATGLIDQWCQWDDGWCIPVDIDSDWFWFPLEKNIGLWTMWTYVNQHTLNSNKKRSSTNQHTCMFWSDLVSHISQVRHISFGQIREHPRCWIPGANDQCTELFFWDLKKSIKRSGTFWHCRGSHVMSCLTMVFLQVSSHFFYLLVPLVKLPPMGIQRDPPRTVAHMTILLSDRVFFKAHYSMRTGHPMEPRAPGEASGAPRRLRWSELLLMDKSQPKNGSIHGGCEGRWWW